MPDRALRLLTYRELELMVCGDAFVDVPTLRSHATYQGWDARDRVVQSFWRVFAALSNEDRSKFIRFTWGRSRLPKPAQWTKPFKLTKKNGGDGQLPIAHTWCAHSAYAPHVICGFGFSFFQIELPSYSSDEVMRKNLLIAIHYGTGGEFHIA